MLQTGYTAHAHVNVVDVTNFMRPTESEKHKIELVWPYIERRLTPLDVQGRIQGGAQAPPSDL